jgi:hypothetical protein
VETVGKEQFGGKFEKSVIYRMRNEPPPFKPTPIPIR